jgi:RNA polymerase sigma-70 factor (ECF subfamily)
LTEQLASTDESATSHVSTRELLLRSLCASVVRHLEQLPPKNAWAVVLHHMHGCGMQEIATIMGLSVAAAQVRVSRGRRELHERVAADPELAGALDLLEAEAP